MSELILFKLIHLKWILTKFKRILTNSNINWFILDQILKRFEAIPLLDSIYLSKNFKITTYYGDIMISLTGIPLSEGNKPIIADFNDWNVERRKQMEVLQWNMVSNAWDVLYHLVNKFGYQLVKY